MSDPKDMVNLEKVYKREAIEETLALVEVVDEFAKYMKRRLIQRQKEGWVGWRDKEFMIETLNIDACIKDNVDNGDNIDAACWAMFRWHHTSRGLHG